MKLRNNKGETLIEVLVSILIATLSVALLFTCVMASSRIDDSAKKLDAKHYRAFSEAEAYSAAEASPVPGAVTITRADSVPEVTVSPRPIEIYGGEGMYSYKEKQP